MQITGYGEGVIKKMVEVASDVAASGKEVKFCEKAEYKQGEIEAILVIEQIQIEEKNFFGRC